jgi:hypothetical protein
MIIGYILLCIHILQLKDIVFHTKAKTKTIAKKHYMQV